MKNKYKSDYCVSVSDYIHAIINIRKLDHPFGDSFLSKLNRLLKSEPLTEKQARRLERVFKIDKQIFIEMDRMYRIEQEYLYLRSIRNEKRKS